MSDNFSTQQSNVGTYGGLGLGLATLAYNIYSNERANKQQNKLNRLGQNNFEHQYEIMSRDLQNAGYNPSALFNVSSASSGSANSSSIPNPVNADVPAMIQAISQARLAKSQQEVNNSIIDKNTAEAEKTRSEHSFQSRENFLARLHEMSLQKFIEDTTTARAEARNQVEKDIASATNASKEKIQKMADITSAILKDKELLTYVAENAKDRKQAEKIFHAKLAVQYQEFYDGLDSEEKQTWIRSISNVISSILGGMSGGIVSSMHNSATVPRGSALRPSSAVSSMGKYFWD